MKVKMTKKQVKKDYTWVIKVGYCNLQSLLALEEAVGFTANAYGWRSDIYNFDLAAICTGYEPFGNVTADYDVCKKYDTQARNLLYNDDLDRKELYAKIHRLILEFIEEVTA